MSETPKTPSDLAARRADEVGHAAGIRAIKDKQRRAKRDSEAPPSRQSPAGGDGGSAISTDD